MENLFCPAIVKVQVWRFFSVLLFQRAELERDVLGPDSILGIQRPYKPAQKTLSVLDILRSRLNSLKYTSIDY